MLGRTETRTRDRMYCETIRTVRDISRDDRARIATCSLRTPTDTIKENYCIDANSFRERADNRYEQFETPPKTIEQVLRSAVGEQRQTYKENHSIDCVFFLIHSQLVYTRDRVARLAFE